MAWNSSGSHKSNFVWICGLVIVQFALSVDPEETITITGAPRNVAVLQNDTASFSCVISQRQNLDAHGVCSFEERITYVKGRAISYDSTIVYGQLYDDNDRASRYQVSMIARGSYELNVTQTQLEDGGKYACVARNNRDIYRTAELIVLDDHPKCTSNALGRILNPGDTVEMSCFVRSRGRWRPEMEWTADGSNNKVVMATQQQVTRGDDFRYTIKVIVNKTDNGRVYVVRTYFKRPHDVGDFEAINTPTYQHIYQFDPLNVNCNCTTQSSRYVSSTSQHNSSASHPSTLPIYFIAVFLWTFS